MLRPIHDQKTRRDGQMSPELSRALQWWIDVLRNGLCERRAWRAEQGQPVHLFCDASGSPAHLGAVLLIDNRCYFTNYAPSDQLLQRFRRRRDNQIMGLELLSISLGLCTFEGLLRGRKVVVHSDNTGSEVSIDRAQRRALAHGVVVVVCGVCVAGSNPAWHCSLSGSCAVGPHAVDADSRARTKCPRVASWHS